MSSKLKQVKVNLKPDVHAELKQLADEQGMTIAELFRTMIGTTIDNAPVPKPKRVHKEADPEMLRLFRNMANNINQIATYANRKKALDAFIYDELMKQKEELRSLL